MPYLMKDCSKALISSALPVRELVCSEIRTHMDCSTVRLRRVTIFVACFNLED